MKRKQLISGVMAAIFVVCASVPMASAAAVTEMNLMAVKGTTKEATNNGEGITDIISYGTNNFTITQKAASGSEVSCYTPYTDVTVDLNKAPNLYYDVTGTAGMKFNIVIRYDTADPAIVKLSESNMECGKGTFDLKKALTDKGAFPADGILKVQVAKYTVSGDKDGTVTFNKLMLAASEGAAPATAATTTAATTTTTTKSTSNPTTGEHAAAGAIVFMLVSASAVVFMTKKAK